MKFLYNKYLKISQAKIFWEAKHLFFIRKGRKGRGMMRISLTGWSSIKFCEISNERQKKEIRTKWKVEINWSLYMKNWILIRIIRDKLRWAWNGVEFIKKTKTRNYSLEFQQIKRKTLAINRKPNKIKRKKQTPEWIIETSWSETAEITC